METKVIPTGLRAIDDRFKGGIKRGQLVCFASGVGGRSTLGASNLTQQLLIQHARNSRSVMYLNYEGPKD